MLPSITTNKETEISMNDRKIDNKKIYSTGVFV